MPALVLILSFFLVPLNCWSADDPIREVLQDYLEFADYSAGAISAEQLLTVGLDAFFIIDTRQRHQFARDHLPGAVHIEWRTIVAQENKIPKDKPVLLYCDTGLLSAKAHFALQLLGHDNVKVLFGGLNSWKIHQGLHADEPR